MQQPTFSLSIVALDVEDWPGMVSFYCDVLGFEPIALESEHRYGWLRAGPITLALRGVDGLPDFRQGRVSLQFKVDNLDETIGGLEESGCAFYDEQLDTGEKYKVAYFRDPEGNPLAVYTQG